MSEALTTPVRTEVASRSTSSQCAVRRGAGAGRGLGGAGGTRGGGRRGRVREGGERETRAAESGGRERTRGADEDRNEGDSGQNTGEPDAHPPGRQAKDEIDDEV